MSRNILFKDHVAVLFITKYYHRHYAGYRNRKLTHLDDARQHPLQVCGDSHGKAFLEGYLSFAKHRRSSTRICMAELYRTHQHSSSCCSFPHRGQNAFHLPASPLWMLWSYSVPSLPLKQEEVDVIVALGEEVSKDSCWVATTDLVGRQPEVNTFYKVPKLGNQVLTEFPKT